jgi:hypothetical protein
MVIDGVDDILAGILVALACAGFVIGLYLWTRPDAVCVQKRVVTSIGGCNSGGRCGVMLDGELVDAVIYPVVGQSVCTEWRRQ